MKPDAPPPVSAIDCGLLLAESLNLKLALRAPAALGAKMIFAVQLADAASVAPHVLLKTRKSPGFVPANPMLLIVIEVVPLFSALPSWAPLPPTGTETQLRLGGVTDALPDEFVVPVPVNETFCGVLLAESLKFSVALRAPVVVGPKMIFAVQLADAASEAPQVLLNTRKSPGFMPVNVMLLIVIAAVPLFLSVITFWAPFPPTGTDTQFSPTGETDTCAMAVVPCTKQIPNAAFTRRARRARTLTGS